MTKISVALSDDVALVHDPAWHCQHCHGSVLFLYFETSHKVCAPCEFARAGSDTITMNGWALTKTVNQIVACRIRVMQENT